MVKLIKFSADDGELCLEIADNGWTECRLSVPAPIALGAQMIDYIVLHLKQGLAEDFFQEKRDLINIDGLEARYLLLLSEAHNALFVAPYGTHKALLWRNVLTEPFPDVGRMTLTKERCSEWLKQLDDLEK